MSSILTNNSAMVALQTLRGVNMNLAKTQDEISTGKSIATAKDSSAIWAISKVMESDVSGFKAISDSLSLGDSTVAVARQASETVTDLLTQMKEKIVASQEENVDRVKLQADIEALRDQIGSVTTAAQFNGLNLLSNREAEAGTGTVNVLSSLDRSGTGVTASDISVSKNDLGTTASAIVNTATAADFVAAEATAQTLNATQTQSLDLGTVLATAGDLDAGAGYALNIFGVDADGSTFTPADYNSGAAAATTVAGDMPNIDTRYVVRDGDTASDVAAGLFESVKSWMAANALDSDVFDVSLSGDTLTFTSTVTDATDTIGISLSSVRANSEDAGGSVNTIGGGLETLANIDVTSDEAADISLDLVERYIQRAIDSAADFGSSQGRIQTQLEFVSGLTDALTSGIGALVDADMEAASARLQALQVQQQLAVQALSIANQAPQTILTLFR